MSELPQPADPDLHAIFGIDGQPEQTAEPVIAVERGEGAADASAYEPAGFGEPVVQSEQAFEVVPDTREDWGPEAAAQPPAAPVEPVEGEAGWTGITRPSKRGASPRFLTDVIIEMQLATQRQVEDA